MGCCTSSSATVPQHSVSAALHASTGTLPKVDPVLRADWAYLTTAHSTRKDLASVEGTTLLLTFPDDVLSSVFQYLSLHDLIQLELVCTQFRAIVQQIFQQRYENLVATPIKVMHPNWKIHYVHALSGGFGPLTSLQCLVDVIDGNTVSTTDNRPSFIVGAPFLSSDLKALLELDIVEWKINLIRCAAGQVQIGIMKHSDADDVFRSYYNAIFFDTSDCTFSNWHHKVRRSDRKPRRLRDNDSVSVRVSLWQNTISFMINNEGFEMFCTEGPMPALQQYRPVVFLQGDNIVVQVEKAAATEPSTSSYRYSGVE